MKKNTNTNNTNNTIAWAWLTTKECEILDAETNCITTDYNSSYPIAMIKGGQKS